MHPGRWRGRWWLAAALIAVFGLGYLAGRGGSDGTRAELSPGDPSGIADGAQATLWTCSMHPQIQQPDPGLCPLCGMELIPVQTGDLAAEAPGELTLSAAARERAGVATAPVERRRVAAEIRMVGKVDYDETRLATISAWVPGRLDRLYIDYTGLTVRQGDRLIDLYSPELLTAREELVQSLRAVQDYTVRGQTSLAAAAEATLAAGREKLRLWGLTPAQIAAIEQGQDASDHVTIHAPISGVVIHKNALEGMYVETGTPIYTIADLSTVWTKLDAYESDIGWLRVGQEVELRAEAYPGETFRGTIAFIDPVLDDDTRAVKVRVNVPNPQGKLKPQMFVRALVRAEVGSGGHVAGLELGSARGGSATGTAPLVIPATAPLLTGKRAIVYVADPMVTGKYTGREVELGPRAGDDYVVLSGLAEGEQVVVSGGFKIDSAIQIMAGPSMMNRADVGSAEPKAISIEVPDSFRREIDRVYDAYFGLQQALSLDEGPTARQAAGELAAVLAQLTGAGLPAGGVDTWEQDRGQLEAAARAVQAAADIAAARTAFEPLSVAMIAAAQRYGSVAERPILRYHCPMAFDWEGADWLQNVEGTTNPYFGSAMYKCGSQTAVIYAGRAGGGQEGAGASPAGGGHD